MTIRTAFTLRRRDRRARPAGADPQGQPDHAAAGRRTSTRLQRHRGVTLATHQTWFGGIYQDPSNFFAQIAVEPEPFLKMYPEFKLPPEQMQGLAGRSAGRDRRRRPGRSASAGRSATAFRSRARSGSRSRARSGSSTSSASTTASRASTRRSSSSATTTSTRTARGGEGLVGWYVVKIADPSQAQAMGANVRRDVRQLVGRNQDHDREGLRRGLRQADRRHRRDHDRDPRRRAVHDAAGRGQHDGAGGARAHERARRAEDARLLRTARSWRWCSASRCSSRCSAAALGLGRRLAVRAAAAIPTGGMLPIFVLPARDVAIGVGADGRCSACWPACCRRSAAMRLQITDALRRA